jgi:uncharacterized protein (DUF433 family)
MKSEDKKKTVVRFELPAEAVNRIMKDPEAFKKSMLKSGFDIEEVRLVEEASQPPFQHSQDVANAHPGIDFQENVCGGAARVIRTRIPVWLLESLRRGGKTDAELLAAYPSLNAKDLANAWNYARSHREEMDREIDANEDISQHY